MIYVDTSVILAELLVEDRRPKASLWGQPLVSSRLLHYETWTRVNALGLAASHGERTRELVGQISLLELHPEVLTRATEPFPLPVRTLDALHLASVEFLRGRGESVKLASFDARMALVARKLKIPLADVLASPRLPYLDESVTAERRRPFLRSRSRGSARRRNNRRRLCTPCSASVRSRRPSRRRMYPARSSSFPLPRCYTPTLRVRDTSRSRLPTKIRLLPRRSSRPHRRSRSPPLRRRRPPRPTADTRRRDRGRTWPVRGR